MILDSLNAKVFDLIWGLSHRSPILDGFGVVLAVYLPYLLLIGAVILIVNMKGSRRRVAFFCQIVLATILSRGLITEVLHFFYHHARPFEALHLAPLISEADWSFPSGHAAFYFALAASIYFFDRNIGLWYFLLAALNGVARIFVGVHWPLDVLGGAVIGFVCAALVYNVLKKYIQNGGEGPLSAPTSGGTAKE